VGSLARSLGHARTIDFNVTSGMVKEVRPPAAASCACLAPLLLLLLSLWGVT
jgi:hypothetical protein